MTTPQQSVDRLFKGIAAVAVGLLIFFTAGLYEWLTGDDPAPAATRPSTAQMMADLDQHAYPASAYQQLLDAWSAKCSDGEYTLAGYVYASLQDLQTHGVHGDTEYSVLTGLNAATPVGTGADCKGIAAAYLVTRESR